MTSPEPVSANEARRLDRLRELLILDSEPEAVFDTIARTASDICGVPIALITLVDAERQWFKANVGLPGFNETPRDIAFCAHAIGSDAVFEVPDATIDTRFANNPLVTGSPDIRFYAGAPLVLPDGERVGTLCVIDREAGHLSAAQKHMLGALATIAVQALTMRRDLIVRALSLRSEHESALAANEEFLRKITDAIPVRMAYVDREMRYRFVNRAYCERFGRSRDQIIGHTQRELSTGTTDEMVEPNATLALRGQEQRFEFDEQVGAETRRIESQMIPDVLDTGDVHGFFSTGVDITDRSTVEKALRELTAIFDNTTDYVVQTDVRGYLIYMNPAARRATGLALDECISHRNFSQFNTAATNQQFAEVVIPATEANDVWVGQATVYAANQRQVAVSQLVIAHRNAGGLVEHYSAVMRDISAELEAKEQLLRQSNTLRSVLEATPALMVVVGADRRYRFVNSAYERWSATTRSTIIGHTLIDVLGKHEYEIDRHWVDQVLSGENVSFFREYGSGDRMRHLSVNFIPLWANDGTVDGFVGVAHDVTRHKQEETRLLLLSQQDGLTGLLNRTGFEAYLEHRVGQGNGAHLALLFIDLDHFKTVNDQNGHTVGDQVLQIFAQRLQRLVRPADGVARIGGDEFAVAFSGIDEVAVARTVAQKVIDAASAPFPAITGMISIGASVGIALGIKPGADWQDLVARADDQTYRAKAAGRGRYMGPGY